jgi:hypothetical protein
VTNNGTNTYFFSLSTVAQLRFAMGGMVLPSEGKRPISLLDVVFGSIGSPLIFTGIFYGLNVWLSSPSLLSYPLNLISVVPIVIGVSLAS